MSVKMVYGLDPCLVLSCSILLVSFVVWMFFLSALIYSKIHLHRPPKQDLEKCGLPGVSIAKPLCSPADSKLVQNLETYFELDYPEFELLFCIQDRDDVTLLKIVQDLMAKYPNIDAKVFPGAKDVVTNPKVNNLLNAYDNAKYPLFLISDANVRMKPDSLEDMVHHLSDKVGLVHQVPIMCDGDDLSFSRQVEQIWFGGAHARVYVAANAWGVNCMTSMSCIFRKKIVDEEGGLKVLGCYLGEDYFLGQLIMNKGYRVVLSSMPALQNPGVSSVSVFQARMKRWMYLRFTEMPVFMLLEPIQEHIFLAPLTALSLYYIFDIPVYVYIPIHYLVWMIADYILLSVMQNKLPSFSVMSFVKGWIFRELSPIYLIPQVYRTKTITWGGKKFIVHFGGLAERIHDDKLIS